jgi:DNA-binding NarL/FixJ family response regulator
MAVASESRCADCIGVLIVDAHPIARLGLRTVIETQPDMTVVGEARDGTAGLRLIERTRTDVTVIDMRLPGDDGPEVIENIRMRSPRSRILVLAAHEAPDDVLRAARAGAHGYLSKRSSPEATLEAIRRVNAGEYLLCSDLIMILIERRNGPQLTAGESRVLELAGRGLSNREIAARLSICEDTVKYRLKQTFGKLQASNRTEAVLRAVQHGALVTRTDDRRRSRP